MFYISSVVMGGDACIIPHSEKYKEVYPPCETLITQVNHTEKCLWCFTVNNFGDFSISTVTSRHIAYCTYIGFPPPRDEAINTDATYIISTWSTDAAFRFDV